MVAGRQLRALGWSASAVESRIRQGALIRLHRGVYAIGYRPLTVEGRWMAAVLACGDGAVLSHRSAGCLWRILPFRPVVPEVTSPRQCRSRPAIATHRMALRSDEVTEEDGISVTSAARAVFDLAAISTPREVERAFHELEVRRLWGPVSVRELVRRYPGHRGVATVRQLLASNEPAGVTRNEFEEAFAALLDAHGLPRPRFNADLAVRGRFFEVDCLWEDQRLIAELDGGAAHRTDRSFQRDRKRDRILLAEGWRTIRITWHQLRDEPEAIVADLRAALYP